MNNDEQKSNKKNLYFLGPKGEQRKFFQEIIELINNDMIFWRRNFHPKDPLSIPYNNLTSKTYIEYQENFMQSLMSMMADLKNNQPFFSPRYIAHMTSDVNLPSLIGYYAGLLYHSNNVSPEASEATLKFELTVGKQFAELFQYDSQSSFGHIASGGTVANLESVFYNMNYRFVPLSLALSLKRLDFNLPNFLKKTAWELCNVPLDEVEKYLIQFNAFCRENKLNPENLLEDNSIAKLGQISFWSDVSHLFKEKLGTPVIIVPSSAHYSWSKSANVFGIGRNQCLRVKLDNNLCMSISHLNDILESCSNNKNPIIQLVCVTGSTEFGNFDNLNEILNIKKQLNKIYFPIHLDAAYGGYFKCMFVKGNEKFAHIFTSSQQFERMSNIFNACQYSDSFTVDPHKLGGTPYGAGVFVTKHGKAKDFVAEEAAYCLATNGSIDEKLQHGHRLPLGKYILEGSKPGASASSVYLTHKLIPLNQDGFGDLLADYCQLAKEFSQLIQKHFQNDQELALKLISEPQSNIVCFFIKPKSMQSLSLINRFNQNTILKFFPRQTVHVQDYDYIVSKTHLYFSNLQQPHELDPIKNITLDDDHVVLFRLVFMNRWVNDNAQEDKSYIEDFIDRLLRHSKTSLHEQHHGN